jgi:hypothetical protein
MADAPPIPSAKEIKRMREFVWYYKWFILLWSMAVFLQFASAAAKFICLRRLCARTGISLSNVWDVTWVRDLNVDAAYPGARILTTGLAQDILLHLVFGLVFVGFFFIFRFQNRRNKALLYYIDRDGNSNAPGIAS